MNFRLKTKAEVEEEVRKTREIPVDEDVSEICGLGDELVALLRSQPTREEPIPPARPMSKAEEAAFEGRLVFETVYGESGSDALPANMKLRGLVLQQELTSLQKTFGKEDGRRIYEYLYEEGAPSRRQRITLTADTVYNLRRSAAIGKLPGRQRDLFSEGILKALDEHGDDLNVDATQFIRAYCTGDEGAMRAAARRLAAA